MLASVCKKDTPELRHAAKCTTLVIVDVPFSSGNQHRYFGTAPPIFCSPPGHNTFGPQGPLKNVRIRIAVSYNLLQTRVNLLTSLSSIGHTRREVCKVVGSMTPAS